MPFLHERDLHNYTTFPDPVSRVDPRDENTADRHVKRDPSMLRLTGKHPFNSEPPLKLLETGGFITPNQFHFVRNHGPVPQLSWDTHRIEIYGLVYQPTVLTMEDILSLPQTTLPVTLVCAGNRRKEQNMHKQSIGFSWGPAALSTACWTGVFLRDVINRFAGGLKDNCNFIRFEGGDQTAKGCYGTSLASGRVMSEYDDVLLAYKMNGELLSVDHGYPIRVITPGCVGGRSVKWLARIEASESESMNHYHFHDNKILPAHIRSTEQATEEGWWFKNEYALYDLNVNSVIATPTHRERVELSNPDGTYVTRGYAYAGGNRGIARVEVSLDGGASWRLADLRNVPSEKLASFYGELVGPSYYKQSRNWTWVRWSLEIDLKELAQAEQLIVRAWDTSQNTQPEHLAWNILGMMNNCWFRVKLSVDRQASSIAVLCEHPTTPSPSEIGGWMEKGREADASASRMAAATKPDVPTYSMDDVRKHTSEDDCWIVVHDFVYDCTRFLKDHPGGTQSILITGGTDTTEDFDAIHSEKAHGMLKDYLIGRLSTAICDNSDITPQAVSMTGGSGIPLVSTSPQSAQISSSDEPETELLDTKQWKKIVLESKQSLSPIIRLFRFTFDPSMKFGLPVGKHVYLKLLQESLHKDMPRKSIMRAYTPSLCGTGYVEFIVKIYFPKDSSSPGGAFTQMLDKVRIGETVDVKGPLGEYEYSGNSQYTILRQPKRSARHIGMIAGGTGITPMWQILCALQHDGELPYVSLIYCASYKADLVLAEEISSIQTRLPDRFKVRYILSKPPLTGRWEGGRGRLNAQEVTNHLFPFANTHTQDEDKLVLLCASEDMIDKCCKPIVTEVMGCEFASKNVFAF